MDKIQAVLWDMDGVLIDSEKLVQRAFIEIMTEFDVMENPAERYLETIGSNHESTVQWYLSYVDSRETADRYYHQVRERYLSKVKTDLQLKSGVIDALQCVASLGLPQMVVTSSVTESAQEKLLMFGLDQYIHQIIGGDQVKEGKPHPEPYLKACELLDVDPTTALVVEDSPHGVAAGLAAGCGVLHVPDLIATDPVWREKILGSLDSLQAFPSWLHQQP